MALVLILGKLKSVPLTFVLGMFITTAAELAASYMLDLFIDGPLWDYDIRAFSFQGRIALGSSLIFGALCVLLIKSCTPLRNILRASLAAGY